MKNTLIIFCILLFATVASAQVPKPTPEKDQSKFEAFSSRSGALLEKTFVPVDTVSGVEIQVLRVNDLLSKTSILAMRLTKTVSKSYSTDEKIAVLDSDEYIYRSERSRSLRRQ